MAQLNQAIAANLLSVIATFGQSTLSHNVSPNVVNVTVTFPGGIVEGGDEAQTMQPNVVSVSATMPTAAVTPGTASLLGGTFTVSLSFPEASLSPGVAALVPSALSIIPSFGTSALGSEVDLDPGALSVPVTFGTAEIALNMQFLVPDTLNVTVVFPRSITGHVGGSLVAVDTEAQGIAQEMVAARGGPDDLDYIGCLQYLSGTNLDKLGCLNALGATFGADLLLSVWQITNDGGPTADINEITRRWALSGNF